MPARVVVHLGSAKRRRPVPPPHTGPAVYHAVLGALGGPTRRNALSAAVHDARGGAKPLACTPLLDENCRLASVDSETVGFEVGVLDDGLVKPIMAALEAAGDLRVARCLYAVDDVECTDAATYEELAESANPTAADWTVRLVTPVAFETAREEGARRLRTLPEPEWVFGSLLSRWRTFAPTVTLASETDEAIARHLAVADWQLERANHLIRTGNPAKDQKDLIWRGSVGVVVYQLVEASTVPGRVRASLDALTRLATYAGVGDRTNVGMGHILPLPHPRRERW